MHEGHELPLGTPSWRERSELPVDELDEVAVDLTGSRRRMISTTPSDELGTFEIPKHPKKTAVPKRKPPKDKPAFKVRMEHRLDVLITVAHYLRFAFDWTFRISLRRRNKAVNEKLWSLRKVQKIIVVCNTKGGSGKTVLVTWLSALYARILKAGVLAFDINQSPGGTSKRLGVPRENTLQLRETIEKVLDGTLDSLSSVFNAVERHRESGVMVVASEAKSKKPIAKPKFIVTMVTLKKFFALVFADCGNDPMAAGNHGAVECGQTLVFVGNIHMADSVDDLGNTRDVYNELGDRTLSDKVEEGIVVIVGEQESKRGEYATRFDVPIERVHIIPFNKYMKSGKVVRFNRIPFKMHVILKETLASILEAESFPYLDTESSKLIANAGNEFIPG